MSKIAFVSFKVGLLEGSMKDLWINMEKKIPSITKFKPEIFYIDSIEGVTNEEKKKLQSLEIVFICSDTLRNPQILPSLTNVKWLQLFSAGADSVLKNFPVGYKPSFKLVKNTGYFDSQMCSLVLSWICGRERKLEEYKKQQQDRVWREIPCRLMDEVTVGIVGFGSIGKKLAQMCLQWETNVVAFVRKQQTADDIKKNDLVHENLRLTSDLGVVLNSSDYIVSILPSTPHTRGFFDNQVFQQCSRPGTCFINIGRGDVISEESIVQALEQKWISHALLDVFAQEPLPKESVLWGRNDVTILPHVTGRVLSADKMVKSIEEKYDLFVRGQDIPGTVDWDKMY